MSCHSCPVLRLQFIKTMINVKRKIRTQVEPEPPMNTDKESNPQITQITQIPDSDSNRRQAQTRRQSTDTPIPPIPDSSETTDEHR